MYSYISMKYPSHFLFEHKLFKLIGLGKVNKFESIDKFGMCTTTIYVQRNVHTIWTEKS